MAHTGAPAAERVLRFAGCLCLFEEISRAVGTGCGDTVVSRDP